MDYNVVYTWIEKCIGIIFTFILLNRLHIGWRRRRHHNSIWFDFVVKSNFCSFICYYFNLILHKLYISEVRGTISDYFIFLSYCLTRVGRCA